MAPSIRSVNERADRSAIRARSFSFPGDRIGVLLIHGFAGSIDDLRPLAEALRKNGHSVSGVRLAGHGTTVGDLTKSRGEDWIASARSALAMLAGRTDRIVLVGESMGGMIALRLAREYSVVRGVVLLAPPFSTKRERSQRLACTVLPGAVRLRKPWLTDDMLAQHRAKGSLIEVTVASYRQLLRIVDAEKARLRKNVLPILALFSMHDYSVDPASAEMLQAALPPSQLSTVMVDDEGHHLVSGAKQREVVQAIASFIGRTAGGVPASPFVVYS